MLKSYATWAAQQPTNKAVVVYDTMWQSTAAMARAIGEGLTAGGTTTKLMPLKSCHRSDVATEILDAGAVLVGSPTINNNIFPTVADTLTYLKGLKPQNMTGAVFGSYGWSGEAVKQIGDATAGQAEPGDNHMPVNTLCGACWKARCDKKPRTFRPVNRTVQNNPPIRVGRAALLIVEGIQPVPSNAQAG